MPKSFWYNGAAWRETVKMWVWASSAWQPVKKMWIWSGGAWVLAFTNVSISNLQGSDVGSSGLNLTWTFTGDGSGMTVDLYADFAGGTNFNKFIASDVTPGDGAYAANFEGQSGFTNVQDTSIRLRLYQGTSLINTLTAYPPWSYG